MKKTILTLLAIFIISSSSIAQELSNPFLSRKEICQLFDEMISEIETLDAEGIEVRNNTKDINWKQYKQYH